LSRIINPDNAGKERTHMTRAVVLAVRILAQQAGPGPETRDLAAFIAVALRTIAGTIETSVSAWEKRGYWVKADRFRMDWLWAGQLGEKMQLAILGEDWDQVATVAAQVAQRLAKVKVPARNRLGTPWIGAWRRLQAGNSKN
jgi:hypothetical protein